MEVVARRLRDFTRPRAQSVLFIWFLNVERLVNLAYNVENAVVVRDILFESLLVNGQSTTLETLILSLRPRTLALVFACVEERTIL